MSLETKAREYNFEYAVAFNQWSMKLLGLWPLHRRFSTIKWSAGLFVTIVFLIPSMAHLVTRDGWELVIEQAITTFPLCLLLIKLSCIKAKAENFKIILLTMIDDWSKFHYLPNWGKKLMIRYAKIGRRVNIICITCMSVSVCGYITVSPDRNSVKDLPRNMTIRKLPTQGLYPFDSSKSPAYEILYTSLAIVTFFYCAITFSLDCFLSVIVFHACGQLSILGKVLANYNKYTKHTEMENANLHLCACLKCIVQRHVFIIEYMEIVERSFNEFVLLQVVGNCFIFAAEGYLLTTYAEDSNAGGFLTFVAYTTTVTYIIFIYCYIGESVIGKSEELADIAYNLEWNSLPPQSVQSLILLMIRSRRPCKITAGRFATMSLSYYRSIITTSISYISVLRAIR